MPDGPYAEGVSRLLTPGERLLAVAEADVAAGVTAPEPPAGPNADAGAGGGPGLLGILLNVLSPLVVFAAGDRAVDRVLHGVAGRGAPGSAASRLALADRQVAARPGLRERVLAATDGRLLLCVTGPTSIWSGGGDPSTAELEVAWSVPRAAVAAARVGRHRLNPKRLRIDFTDGSWAAFTVPIAQSGDPLRAIAAALT
ncbi:hypothetical protein [Micromonospora rubida]|uniref:hypothetical protein n=1 Tax=Micromonospora rubida TaxID=2697657 RepID=UPI001376AA4C|nr:hypothetical protein [Micromonospora rubida]NBE82680.1 hypothetical protein [Micromonospora rubida]